MALQATKVSENVEVTAQTVINQLRNIVQPPGKKGLWLRHLSDKRLAEVYHRLKLGQSSYHITKIAQNEWGIMKDSGTKSLARAVRIFRDKTVGLVKIESATAPKNDPDRRRDIKNVQKRIDRIKRKLDPMQRLIWLIDIQTERVEALHDKEKVSLPFQFTDKSVAELRQLLTDYIDRAMALGILDSKPPELHLKIKHRFDGLLQHAIHGDGSNLIAAADKFLELAEKNSLTMALGEDGTYHPTEEEESDVCATIEDNFEEDSSG